METQQDTFRIKATILDQLQQSFRDVHRRVESLAEAGYRKRPGNRWSPAEQLEHLSLSAIPIVGALDKDRDWFDQFGAPAHPEKDYPALKDYYREVLRNGLKAPGRFTPGEDRGFDKAGQLSRWEQIGEGVCAGLGPWTEEALDQCTMSHPALGILTMRQMLWFTIFHNYHHLQFIRTEEMLT